MMPHASKRSSAGKPVNAPVKMLERGPSINATVYEALKALITGNQLRPGVKLIHQELAERLQVSRTPVRESLERLYRKFQRRGLRVVGICLDDSREEAREFIQSRAITFTVFHDPGGRATRDAWGMPSGPESYLLDASGRVVATFPDPVDWMRDDRRAQVEALLPSPAPGAW